MSSIVYSEGGQVVETTEFQGRVGKPAANTDSVTEGTTNLYFTAARVRASALQGLNTAPVTAITAGDTVLSAFGKLQGQLNGMVTAAGLGDIAGSNLLPDEYSTFPVLPALTSVNISSNSVSTASPVVVGGGELLVTASGANGNVFFSAGTTTANRPNITAQPGKFIVSFWCRSVEATGATQVYLLNANGTLYGGTTIAVTSTRQRYSAVVDASASPLSAFWLRLDNDGGAGTTLAFDGIMVEPQRGAITTPSPYVRGVRAVPLAGDNLLPNAGFEDWITSGSGYPAKWTLGIAGTGAGAITSREHTTTTLGGRGVRVNTTALGINRYIELNLLVANRAVASPGDVLTSSIYMRASAGAGRAQMFFQWRDAANAAIRTDPVTYFPVWSETDFTRLQFSAPPAPAGTVGVTVIYRVLATDTSPAWWVEYACPQLERGTVASGWKPGLASLMADPRFSAPVRSGYGGANAEMGILGTQAYVYGRNSDSPLNPITSFRWGTSATNSWTMDANGVVTGMAPAAGANDGTVPTTAWVRTLHASDRRIKSHLEPVGSTLDKLAGIAAYTYAQQGCEERKLGSIAQAWQEHWPEATPEITYDGEQRLSIDPLAAIAILTQALNELHDKVKRLEATQ